MISTGEAILLAIAVGMALALLVPILNRAVF